MSSAHSSGTSGVAEVATMLSERDQIDRTRSTSPLYMADDAILVDTTGQSISDVVASVLVLVKSRMGE